MRAEASRLRSLAERLEAFAAELDGGSQVEVGKGMAESADRVNSSTGEYSGMTQMAAILKALQSGPMTTGELFVRLNEGGQRFKKRTYVTALLGRLKEQVERTEEGKVALKSNGA